MKAQPVSVLLVDDLDSFRRAAAAVVAAADGFELAGEADCGEAAIAFLERRPVGLVLMDVQMPGIGGIGATAQIRRRFPGLRVILLSVSDQDAVRRQAAAFGVQYCWKAVFGPDELETLWEVGHPP